MSVYKRGGVWYYDFWFNGERYAKSTQAKNKRDAETIERKRRNDLALGEYGLAAPKVTPVFQTYVEGKFLDHIRVRSANKPRTVKFYAQKMKRLIAYPDLAEARLKAIDEDMIERYVQFRAKQKVKVATINRDLAGLRHALHMAVFWKLLPKVPKIRLLPGEVGRDFVLSYDLEKAYLAAAPQPLNDAAVLMLDTGLRPQECLSLPWTQVHFEPAPNAKFGYVAVTEGKSVNAKRNIPLTERAQRMLELRRAVYADSPWVFPGQRKGKPLTIWGVDNLHRTTREDTVDEQRQPIFPNEFVLYSLRHTFGTRLGESGADPYAIMKLMGHSSILMSEKYVHPTPEHVERAMARKELLDRMSRGDAESDFRANSPDSFPNRHGGSTRK